MSRVAALVAAAGEGTRLGLGPKAFVELSGSTLLELTVAAFAPLVDEIVVAVPPAALGRARALAPSATVIAGGDTRQATVLALLGASSGEVVLVHDVARPFVTPDVVRRVVAGVTRTGAASAALPPADTVVAADDGRVLPRERLRLIQTPQGFRRELLLRAHERALADAFAATDDAALVRRLGEPVELVPGSPLLSKLTTPDDLAVAEALLAVWRGRVGEPA